MYADAGTFEHLANWPLWNFNACIYGSPPIDDNIVADSRFVTECVRSLAREILEGQQLNVNALGTVMYAAAQFSQHVRESHKPLLRVNLHENSASIQADDCNWNLRDGWTNRHRIGAQWCFRNGISWEYLQGAAAATAEAHRQLQRRLQESRSSGAFWREKELYRLRCRYRTGKYKWMNLWRQQTIPIAASNVPECLISIQHLRELRSGLECGYIYFLLHQDEVVYVGQSVDLANRAETHKKDKQFDRVLFIEVSLGSMNSIERHFIRRLMPKYNQVHNQRRKTRGYT